MNVKTAETIEKLFYRKDVIKNDLRSLQFKKNYSNTEEYNKRYKALINRYNRLTIFINELINNYNEA